MKPTSSSSPQRHESASAPAVNHRHPFLQSRRQPHQHGGPPSETGGGNASALDVTAAEKSEHHPHAAADVENAAGASSPPASVVVAPAPGDPARPSTDGESHTDDDEVREAAKR